MTTLKEKRQFPAKTAALKDVRSFFAETVRPLGYSQDDLDQLTLAVDEAATNIIKHGLRQLATAQFSVEISTAKGSLLVTLVDRGVAFNPDTFTEPEIAARIRQKRRGGLGIYLMRQIMDDVQFERRNGSNLTRLIKRLPSHE
jgi:serine/threonine-protein kinase RsbW